MKFSAATVLVAATAAAAAPAPSASKSFGLAAYGVNVEKLKLTGSKDVYYANSSLFIGGIQNKPYAEKVSLTTNDADFFNYTPGDPPVSGQTNSLSFTRASDTPTSWQTLYILPNSTEPVGFTPPHSAHMPEGAVTGPFRGEAVRVIDGDKLFVYDGPGFWQAVKVDEKLEENTYQIHFTGYGKNIEGGVGILLSM